MQEEAKKDEGSTKKMKYTQPGLISLDKGQGAEGGGGSGFFCDLGNIPDTGVCVAGSTLD